MRTSSDPAIEVRGLAKRYRLGEGQGLNGSLREAIVGKAASALHLARGRGRRRDTIWALDDVSFEVERGEALGVIGPNGAGKTTLLKILSRITDPTKGEARIWGRVGSLLEVGTGFHPDLTGRENIFLNGAILGMRKREIELKFDEIVTFAGVERFIDTPVKRYSSGMYVRLAFAVAAHLDTDILLVDEVLSVGDFAFQRRSLGKMQEQTTAEGRTVLFVSHNLAAVKTLTQRCLWLDKGKLRQFGPTEDVFREYVLSYSDQAGSGYTDLSDLAHGRPCRAEPLVHDVAFQWVEFRNPSGERTAAHMTGEPITFRLGLRARRLLRDERVEIRCRVSTLEGLLVFSASSGAVEVEWEPGLYETEFTLEPNPLGAGTYVLELVVFTVSETAAARGQDVLRSAATFHVVENPATSGEERYAPQDKPALIRVNGTWESFTPVGEPAGAGRSNR